jgi:hypothetical protein
VRFTITIGFALFLAACPGRSPSGDGGVGPPSDARCELQDPSTRTCQGGAMCTLSDGERGVCHSLVACCALGHTNSDCAGVACRPGASCVNYHCIYDTCDALASNSPCHLASGGLGVCCGLQCLATDLMSDSENCGSCGIVCPGSPPAACSAGLCYQRCYACTDGGPNACATCPSGTSCLAPGCAVDDCTGHDGLTCATGLSGYQFCAGGVCASP